MQVLQVNALDESIFILTFTFVKIVHVGESIRK